MADKIYSKVMLYSNFPINTFTHQYFNPSREKRNEEFDKYCNVKIDGEYKGQVEGVNVFSKLATVNISSLTFRLELQNPSYKTSADRIASAYRTAMDYNYGVLIQEGKRYYFFVDDIEWSSNVVTATFRCSCDWWQTYCYDVTFKKSLVEREHTTDDTFGKYLLDENLPTSEYIIQEVETIKPLQKLYYCLSISDVDIVWTDIHQTDHPNLFYEYGLGITQIVLGSSNPSVMQDVVNKFVSNGKIDSLNGFFVCPTDYCVKNTVIVGPKDDDSLAQVDVIVPTTTFDRKTVSRIKAFTDKGTDNNPFVPNNNKCFIYPYHFLNVTNYMGNSVIGKFELSDNNNHSISFDYTFPAIQEGCPVGFLHNYDGLTTNLDTSISGQVNAQIPFITNTYDAWYSVNHNSMLSQFNNAERTYKTTTALTASQADFYSTKAFGKGMVGNLTLGYAADEANGELNPGTLVGNIFNNVMNSSYGIAQPYYDKMWTDVSAKSKFDNTIEQIDGAMKDQQAKGDILHGSYIPTLLNLKSRVGFQMQTMRVTKECAKVIDNYFDMFGYKVNVYKTPQFNSRPLWNYIKCASVNVIGNVPQIALNVIKDMFNGGCTIWHTLSGMYNYDGAHNKVN